MWGLWAIQRVFVECSVQSYTSIGLSSRGCHVESILKRMRVHTRVHVGGRCVCQGESTLMKVRFDPRSGLKYTSVQKFQSSIFLSFPPRGILADINTFVLAHAKNCPNPGLFQASGAPAVPNGEFARRCKRGPNPSPRLAPNISYANLGNFPTPASANHHIQPEFGLRRTQLGTVSILFRRGLDDAHDWSRRWFGYEPPLSGDWQRESRSAKSGILGVPWRSALDESLLFFSAHPAFPAFSRHVSFLAHPQPSLASCIM